MQRTVFPAVSRAEDRWLKQHGTPERVQRVLDSLPYRNEDVHLPALSALRDWRAHCFDGCLLAAAALRRNGFTPCIVDLVAIRDDDHLLCAFRRGKEWGAVAKSNFPGLRFREPIYRSVRELVASYFEFYFNLQGEKSLRSYSDPLRFPPIGRLDWEVDPAAPKKLLRLLATARHRPLITPSQARALTPLDERLFRSQLLGVSLRGAHGGATFSGVRRNDRVRKP